MKTPKYRHRQSGDTVDAVPAALIVAESNSNWVVHPAWMFPLIIQERPLTIVDGSVLLTTDNGKHLCEQGDMIVLARGEICVMSSDAFHSAYEPA